MCYSIMVETNLKKLETLADARVDVSAFDRFHASHQSEPKQFRSIFENERVYPNYFSPIIVKRDQQTTIVPMRYRIRPEGSHDEIPNRFNLFNARIDALKSRNTWKPLYMKRHGLVVIKGFYEWVEDGGKKKVVYFSPQNEQLPYLVVPVIYDIWIAPDKSRGFASFALLTGNPPVSVSKAGHDRCPIILAKENWKSWLSPEDHSEAELMALLEKSQARTAMKVIAAQP